MLTSERLVVASIASLVKSKENAIKITVMPCQKQPNAHDCGVFSIAFACPIALGKFMSTNLRRHLLDCLARNEIIEFQAKTIDRRAGAKTYQYDVYCSCRIPEKIWDDARDSMAACDSCHEWFHKGCEKVPAAVFKDKTGKTTWNCSSCLQ